MVTNRLFVINTIIAKETYRSEIDINQNNQVHRKEMILKEADDAATMPPMVKMPLRDVNALEGRNVRLECVFSGVPLPQIKWYKEGDEIEPNVSNYKLKFNEYSGLASLEISSFNKSDAGRFTCVARNPIGSCSTSATVNVKSMKIHSFAFRINLLHPNGLAFFSLFIFFIYLLF
jgi:hypothetical protein